VEVDVRADVLVGLEGFVVVDVVECGLELEVTVETNATRVGCSSCGVIARAHDRREHVVRDWPWRARALPAGPQIRGAHRAAEPVHHW